MRDVEVQTLEWTAENGLETPFAETLNGHETPVTASAGPPLAFSLAESVSPFAEAIDGAAQESETDRLISEAFSELRDEAFDEALTNLAEETERDVGDRFLGESTTFLAERERFADARLAEVRYEAEQFVDRLEQGLNGLDVESFSEEQLDEAMEQINAEPANLTPAGEEFVGALVRKAKKAVSHVVKTAKAVGKLANPLIGPILKKLRKLINPLLKRVLSFAIGKLPAPLQPAARKLAAKFTSEADEAVDEAEMSPANLTDVEALSEQFDAALAESIWGEAEAEVRYESEEFSSDNEAEGTQQLLALAEARGVLIDRLRDADEQENLAPAIEQFVPALLGALRLGIKIVGRPKVVKFLAGYLSKLISKWVEPNLSGALSNAIVDTGMRLISLEADEAETITGEDEVVPVALAAVVEDTVRRLAEHEEYVFEDEDLMQLAAADSFSQAVGTHFPPAFVRPDLQRAPSLGGTFVVRRPRSVRTYRKFSRVPTVEITPQVADRLRTFGGGTVGGALRARGEQLPMRARMHIFQAAPGTTLGSIARADRALSGTSGAVPSRSFHPLTPQAASVLLREPALGSAVPPGFLRSPNRIAAGQRFYVLQPAEGAGAELPATAAGKAAAARLAPTRAWLSVKYRQGRVTLGIYLSESDAQQIASAIRQGQGALVLTRALLQAARSAGLAAASRAVQREDEEHEELEEFVESEELAGGIIRNLPRSLARRLKRRFATWILPALSQWAKTKGEAFARAANHPDPGVTIRARVTGVPGLTALRQLMVSSKSPAGIAGILKSMSGKPAVTVSVTPGRRRK